MLELHRTSPTTVRLENPHQIPVSILANEQLRIDLNAVEELLGLLGVAETVTDVAEAERCFFDHESPGLVEVVITPDFHRGSGIPIGTVMVTRGFVLPQAIGKDVNCGMRLHATSLNESQVRNRLPDLERRIRHIFFEGGRQIPMRKPQREALLLEGLCGLWQSRDACEGQGIWSWYDAREQERDLDRVIESGSIAARNIPFVGDYLGSDAATYDDQIGSIGGGNHFIEIQTVERIFDGQTAFAWNLRPGQVTVMIHTGSVKLGHPTGARCLERAQRIYPSQLKHPANGVYPLPDSERFRDTWNTFWNAYANAANFAFGNRLFLSLLMRQSLLEVVGDTDFPLLYDAGHNVVTREEIDGQTVYLHRKGATPARGYEAMVNTPFAFFGEPVLIPGSMGASSFVLAGLGSRTSLGSASHGAGRSMSRGDAMKTDEAVFRQFLERFHVVTPIDPHRADIRARPEILRKWEDELRQEAPWSYKDIGPVVDTQVEAGTVRKVAELRPLLTVKG